MQTTQATIIRIGKLANPAEAEQIYNAAEGRRQVLEQIDQLEARRIELERLRKLEWLKLIAVRNNR